MFCEQRANSDHPGDREIRAESRRRGFEPRSLCHTLRPLSHRTRADRRLDRPVEREQFVRLDRHGVDFSVDEPERRLAFARRLHAEIVFDQGAVGAERAPTPEGSLACARRHPRIELGAALLVSGVTAHLVEPERQRARIEATGRVRIELPTEIGAFAHRRRRTVIEKTAAFASRRSHHVQRCEVERFEETLAPSWSDPRDPRIEPFVERPRDGDDVGGERQPELFQIAGADARMREKYRRALTHAREAEAHPTAHQQLLHERALRLGKTRVIARRDLGRGDVGMPSGEGLPQPDDLDSFAARTDLGAERTGRGERIFGLAGQLLHAREVVVAGEDDDLIGWMLRQPAKEEVPFVPDFRPSGRSEVEVIADREETDVTPQLAVLGHEIVCREDAEESIEARLRIAEREPTPTRDAVGTRRLVGQGDSSFDVVAQHPFDLGARRVVGNAENRAGASISRHTRPVKIPSRVVQIEAARARFGDRVDRLVPFLDQVDELGDAAVTFLQDQGEGGATLLARALEHGIDAVSNAPAGLRALFTEVDRVPAWVDWDVIDRGGELLRRAGPLGGIVLGAKSLVHGYASPGGNKPLVFSGRLREQAARRLNETSRYVQAVTSPRGLRRDGDGFAITLKVRLMHAKVRQMILASGRWRAEEWGAPINQHDVTGTSLLFSQSVIVGLRTLGVRVTSAEADSYIHLWRYASWLMGGDAELLPASEVEATRLAELIAATMGPPDDDSRALTRALMESPLTGASSPRARQWAERRSAFGYALGRELLGDELADGLAMPVNSWRFVIPPLRGLVTAMELVREHSPTAHRKAIELGTRYWQRVVELGLAGATAEFGLPQRLAYG